MGKLIDDLKHLSGDIQHIHDDVDHLTKDLDTLSEKAGLDRADFPGLTDLKDHLKDLDSHAHDALSHVAHFQAENLPKMPDTV
jgi:ABC-type transporter Mla subunit MlaD